MPAPLPTYRSVYAFIIEVPFSGAMPAGVLTVRTLRVWDLPTRLFHWTLVLAVAGLVVSGNVGGNWMEWHLRMGYLVLGLLVFRLIWGLIGGHWSRFSSFVRGPAAVLSYLRGTGTPADRVGHNPLGALSVLAMLLVLSLQVGSGLMSDDEIAFAGPLTRFLDYDTISAATNYHKEIGKLLLIALVVLHVLAIAYYQLVKRQRLVPAMLHGDQSVQDPANQLPVSQDSAAARFKALVVATAAAGVVAWVVSLGQA